MSAVVLDTETTGFDEPEIVEAAWCRLSLPGSTMLAHDHFSQRYKPTKMIAYGAMAVHHIAAEDLVKCPASSTFSLPAGTEYLIGHNVDFDWKAIGSPPGLKRICTVALSRLLWPETDSHGQNAMLYLLDYPYARKNARKAHGALADIKGCVVLLRYIIMKLGSMRTWEEVYRHSEVARIPQTITFGKYKGLSIENIPLDYIQWLLRQDDVDPYLRTALERRR